MTKYIINEILDKNEYYLFNKIENNLMILIN